MRDIPMTNLSEGVRRDLTGLRARVSTQTTKGTVRVSEASSLEFFWGEWRASAKKVRMSFSTL